MDKTIYELAGVRFTPARSEIENPKNEKRTKLSPNRCQFLLALVENNSRVVTYDDLRRDVWIHLKEVDRNLKRTVQSTKRDLVKCFETIGVKAEFIKDAPGEGYFLDAPVVKISPEASNEQQQQQQQQQQPPPLPIVSEQGSKKLGGRPLSQSPPEKSNPASRRAGAHFGFILTSSLLYGLLFWLALLLEVAYEFDRYGERALWLGLPLMAWIALTAFVGLTWMKNLTGDAGRRAFLVGLAFFAGGAALACLAMSYFLPAEPITAARFQTQPAFAAWLKNALVYFLPLGVFFILLPFQIVRARQIDFAPAGSSPAVLINLRPVHLFALWLVALIYSALTTFYLLDNLRPGRFHNLFVSLVFLRFFVYFGLGLLCFFWFKTNAEAGTEKPKSLFLSDRFVGRGRRLGGLSALLLVCPTLFLTASVEMNVRRSGAPKIAGVEAVSQVKGGQQFFVRLRGENFDPQSVALQVTGEGCPAAAPCLVPHEAIRKHSEITETALENVPLTLAGGGDFQIAALNSGGPPSNFVVLSVP